MKRTFNDLYGSYLDGDAEELRPDYPDLKFDGSYYDFMSSLDTSRTALVEPIHGLLTPSPSPPNVVQAPCLEVPIGNRSSILQHARPSKRCRFRSGDYSLRSTPSTRSNRSSYTASSDTASSDLTSSESSATSWASISSYPSVMAPGVTPCETSPELNTYYDFPLSPTFDTLAWPSDEGASIDPRSNHTAPRFESWRLPLDAFLVSTMNEINPFSETLQKFYSAQCAGSLSTMFTSPGSDPIPQMSRNSSISQMSRHYTFAQQCALENDRYEQCLLRTPTFPVFSQASSCQSSIPQEENFREKQIAALSPEPEKAVAMSAVADFGNVTTHHGTEIRPVESPDPKPMDLIRDRVSNPSPATTNKGEIQNWRLGIPYASSEIRNDDIRSLSASAFAEEDLEERVSWRFGDDPLFARALICNLKDKVDFILPLFSADEDQDLLEFPFVTTPPAYEQGSSQGTTSNSSGSPESKSFNASTSATPSTSTDSGKEGKSTEGENKSSKSQQPSIKQRRSENSRRSGGQERRRLRCHFHAKCAASHNKRTCIHSGWLSIHNLKGHYDSHHTLIRCNKCFTEFTKKSEKNIHQRNCTSNVTPPTIEAIDCDRADEIDEMISSFRTWKLDDEQDVDMKTWVLKYKPELNNNTKDDAHDSRELAKWYKYWAILFPAYEGEVPTPFQLSPASSGDQKLERWLEVFQSVVEVKLSLNQPPPSEPCRQIDYYKDVIRDVYNLIQPNSTSRTAPSPNTSDARSLLTPTDSSTQASPKPKGSPEVKQCKTTSHETPTEDSDLASQMPEPSEPQLSANCSPPPNTVAQTVPPEHQSFLNPSATAALTTVPSTPRHTHTSVTEPVQSLNETDSSNPHTNLAEQPEVPSMRPHNQGGVNYAAHTSLEESISQMPLSPSPNEPPPKIFQGQPYMSFSYPAATNTANMITGMQNTWQYAPALGAGLYCQYCGNIGFVDLGFGPQTCLFCNHVPSNLEVSS